ncbi:helix-turn-helix transcriptional regulator [Mesorhizobium microcysteis]|uniref:Helix-turn-helix transcriptional regulator n=1 Tax=Neoaquamicrobium microcysteis TaxID=2682781 RepID=A0A5D4H3L2_9HYPH|nr:helix-turn-helix transcriptional regulator [Mesorhizobium microcysteis]TYR34882.1 helix-turn-helix transcriptional regulator [Mesorhizobium microcysteis]
MEIQLLIGWNVRSLRVAKGLSQDDLALAADIERAYVGHLERGKKNPTATTLAKLAGALECHLTELFKDPPEEASLPPPLKGGRRSQIQPRRG